MSKGHAGGGKFSRRHGSLIEVGMLLCRYAERMPEVRIIRPGVIDHGAGGNPSGHQRVKFTWVQGGLRMSLRQSRSVQDVWVYSEDTQTTMVALARAARDNGIAISFQKKPKGELPSE